MSGLIHNEALDQTTIDRAASHDLYTYDALVRDQCSTPIPPSPGTFEHLLDVEFVD